MFINKAIAEQVLYETNSGKLKIVKNIKEQDEIAELINGCIKDDRKSQEKLYRMFYLAMMNLCLRYTRNESDAMEALNLAFYKVFKNIKLFNHEKGSFYTWAGTIVVRSCIDLINVSSKKLPVMELEEVSEHSVPSDVLEKINSEQLLSFIRALSPALRTVFNLFVMEGYSHAEIGKLMSISEGTSKWHLSEAKKQLQKMILTKQ